MTLTLVGVGAAVALGATLQRVSGMGMGLIAAPTLALLLGPIDGVLLIIALSVVTLGKRKVPNVEGVVPAAIAGAVGGFMNTLSGVAGPAITVYSQAARWDQRMYAATLQPIFVVAGALSFAGKELSGAADIGAIDPAIWVSTIAGLVVGVIVGKQMAPSVSKERARRIALSLAFLGGLTALVRGIVGLAG